jgi:hypothetical protein
MGACVFCLSLCGSQTAATATEKDTILSVQGCDNATTNMQPKPDAEPETAVSAKSFH